MTDHPRAALLREMIEPSHHIEPRYAAQILQLENGQIVSGIVVEENAETLSIANNPNQPNDLLQISVGDVQARKNSAVSLMPIGLLNTLTLENILDLFAYVESGANPEYYAFRPTNRKLEEWANAQIPIRSGLQWWLDSSRIEQGRAANGLAPVAVGQRIDAWIDASGYRRTASQKLGTAQPTLQKQDDKWYVEFDGADDSLTAMGQGLSAREFTALIVVRPEDNKNWPGLISANAFYKNDYQSGMNIDLMNQQTERFETLMTEGPGYAGVIDLMNDSYPFGQWVVVTVVSKPGVGGVRLRVNGREQQVRDRPETRIVFDELNVGARFWSNDPGIPPYLRGFLRGGVSQVLLYDRALESQDIELVEKFLQENLTIGEPTPIR